MENNLNYLMSIFKELTTEMPKELIYSESDGIIELKSIESYAASSGTM